MPQSSNAADPPPEPTASEIMQAEVVKLKKLLGLDINRLAIGSDIEGIVTGNPFGANDYTITGASVISFINVSTSIASSQTNAPGFPAQVTGLVVTPISSSQLNLAWTTSGSPNITNYKVYRNSTSIASPVPNSYSDTGLASGTTYAYNVSAVNSSALEGPLSATVNGTTTGSPPPPTESLELHLDSSIVDTSSNAFSVSGTSGNGFILPGAFGTAGWKCNFPTTTGFDYLAPEGTTSPYPTPLQMDTATGFSVSFWINPQDLTSLAFRRVLWEYPQDANNKWSVQIDGGTAYFLVKKAGTDYKAQVTGFTTGSWQHIAATFNGATNTALIYRNAVVGTSSVVASQYGYATSEGGPAIIYMVMGFRVSGVPAPDGAPATTKYMGYYDEIRYYKTVVLTPTQITNLKNTNAP